MKWITSRHSLKYIIALLVILSIQLGAATRNDVKLLEASENLRLISQQIVKDYFYLAKHPHKIEVSQSLQKSLYALDKNLRMIASSTKSEDTKNLLEFLAFSSEEIDKTIDLPFSEENSALMLDYSETLLEGAESIGMEHSYDFTEEEQMLMHIKKMAYLVDRISKYYLAFQAGFDDHNTKEQLQIAINEFDSALGKVNAYEYGFGVVKNVEAINSYWPIAKEFYLSLDTNSLPNIIYLSAKHLKVMITALELYHSKNL